ncbi:MAG TPA: CCA tRNA nucleotidyltransferase, partial [Stellaceae bacterium]|nr:CCA tRNA nucleotidyltransferase [Stellaceae bacterium]
DTLMGRPIADIDIATPVAPLEVMEILRRAHIKVVPTGLDHGTVTAVIGDRHFEITTLRRDVETDGRRAKVAFTDDWAIDARRRDFTMNALFLSADGTVFDHVGGIKDLVERRVRFVGDPSTRIKEDVLRILRFFRFHAHYGVGLPSPEGRDACRALAASLTTLSAERVAAELLKLLAAPDPVPVIALMIEDGVLPVLLPEASRVARLATLVAIDPAIDPLRRLAALLEVEEVGARAVGERLRLSHRQMTRLVAMAAPSWKIDLAADERTQRRALYHLGAETYRDLVLLMANEPQPALLALAEGWEAPVFPLKGADLLRAGMAPGRPVGKCLAELKLWWEEGDFRADRA